MPLRGPTDPNLTPFNSSSLSADEIPALRRCLLVRPFSFANIRNSLEEAQILKTGLLAGQWEIHSTEGKPEGTWAVPGPERPGLGAMSERERGL